MPKDPRIVRAKRRAEKSRGQAQRVLDERKEEGAERIAEQEAARLSKPGRMKAVKKKYEGGGPIDFRTKEEIKADKKAEKKELRAEARQERKDKKDMIPARYRNRGEAGLEAYRDAMANKRAKKRSKGLARIIGPKALRKKAAASRRAARQARRRMAFSRGSGCQGAGCGAYE